MGRNNLQNVPLDVLAAKARAFRDAAEADPAAVGLTPQDVLEIGAGLDLLVARMRAASEAEANLRAAVQDRMVAQKALVDLFAGAANRVYAVPGITPARIAGLGLSPRSTSRARVVPKTPRDVVAAMRESGMVRVKWARSGNAAEVAFVVETRVEDGPWVHAAIVTRTWADLRGVAPGVETWFRVSATRGGATALPSRPAVLWRTSGVRAQRAAA